MKNYLTKPVQIVILPKPCNMEFYALVAQLAEHIHGKDKVISSILIEGYVFAMGKIKLQISGASLV